MPNVKVLLTDKVEKLGEIGEVVSVKPGYARNFLLPEGLATIPTAGEIRRIKKKKELLEKEYQEEKAQAEELGKKISALGDLEILAKAGEAGKLFGSITPKDITDKLNSLIEGKIQRKQVSLKRSINDLGTHPIKVKLHQEVTVEVKVVVKSED